MNTYSVKLALYAAHTGETHTVVLTVRGYKRSEAIGTLHGPITVDGQYFPEWRVLDVRKQVSEK